MIEVRRILCPVDFSDFSRRALHHALALAKWYHSRLSLMYVYHVPLAPLALTSVPAPPSMEGLLLSAADGQRFTRELEALVPSGMASRVPIDYVVSEGDVAAEILAEGRSADMVVLGTHGRSGYEHLLLGSVAEKVLRRASCPVMTVPRVAHDATAAVPALFHHILAAIDFSPASTHALTYALSLAEEADAHLTLLQVMELPRELSEWAERNEEGRQHMTEWTTAATARLQTMVPDAVRVCSHIDARVVVGRPYHEILRVASEQKTDLIVMGVHGHGAIDRMFFGSTAQHVVRQAVCPVLTVRVPGGEK